MAARRATQTNSQPYERKNCNLGFFIQEIQTKNQHQHVRFYHFIATAHHQPITSLDDCKKKDLPLGFADRILELEINLDDQFIEIEKVQELLELYMIGVEYYESIGDQRYIYFNKKMSSMMMKPNVIDAMAREKENKEENDSIVQKSLVDLLYKKYQIQKQKEVALREAEVRQKEETIRKTVNYSIQESDVKAKALLKNVEQEIKQNQKIIHDSLDNQKKMLFERLQNRRTRTLTKASSVPVLENIETSDVDDNSSQEGSNVKISKIDFSAITNAIREDDQEDDNEEDQKKLQRKLSTIAKIKKFKEEMLNGSTSPVQNEIRSNRESFSSINKTRSNSQASSLQKRNSNFQRSVKDKKFSLVKQRKRVKSKSSQQIPDNEEIPVITIEQLKEMQLQIFASFLTLTQKKIEPFQVNMKQVIHEKTEEDEVQSPVRKLKRNN